ncbi:flagellar basal body P-ring formation protein FlgA [Roseomonas stagni]|uniref:Flagellar basal body P-ring formation protein FlgA n=1 Tax=Falsiroseomonas algicola TaxID=2716930 RepID=A0A6M1LF68_9PROT|nr:flagellar basal body P-ring formation chaperone FlgA [Falsiroseomonas algicola]NGM18807.1 flagellar basal body P-ring formation protein FlgA [Falsiroseomonas algicola]
MRVLLLLSILLTAPAAAQETVALKPLSMVEDSVVRLSDLFETNGPRAAVVLGPAPAPGQRQVVEAAQLMAIARQNGIAWRPTGGADRVVLERPGRAVEREEVLVLLRNALRPQGVDPQAEIDLLNFSAPLVPLAAFAQLAVEQAVIDPVAQRFSATLVVAADGMATQRQRVTGRIQPTVAVLVATRRLAIGEVLGPHDVRLVRMPAGRLRPGVAERPEQALGQAVRRPTMAEQPLMLADLTQPLAVERGATVTMLYDIPGMALTAQGRAMEGAARGAVVPVMNLSSRIVVEAQVIAPGRVRVGPGR